MPHYHQLRGNHFLSNLWPRRNLHSAGIGHNSAHDPDCDRDWVDDPPEVDEPDPDDGMRTIDDYTPPTVWQDTDGDVVSD